MYRVIVNYNSMMFETEVDHEGLLKIIDVARTDEEMKVVYIKAICNCEACNG